jgi:hypothetical protein
MCPICSGAPPLADNNMTDKELIQKLNSLKQVSLEASWKKETRDLLLSQISNSAAKEVKISVWEMAVNDLKNSFAFVPRAAWGAICFVLVLVGGGFSVYAANYSKPGDYFYTAKILKEKTQLAMTFDKEEKVKLDMKLASIHAKEISEVLSDPKTQSNGKKAQKLAHNFQTEINTVKERLSEISKIQENNSVVAVGVIASGTVAESSDVKVGIGDLQKDSDGKILSANNGKNAKGVQIYIPTSSPKDVVAVKASTTTFEKKLTAMATGSASSTVAATASSTEAGINETINTTLDKATESFNIKDFTGAKDMLEQVGVIIEKINSSEVKGESESGTSTETGSAAGAVGAVGSSSINK